MKLGFRFLIDDDYPKLVEWWKWFRFPAPPKDCLPEDGKGGIMVTIDGIEVCAGFLYFTNSKIAWLEFIVSNPEYKNKDRKIAIKECIYLLCDIAKKKDVKAIYTSVQNENLINSYVEVGFIKSNYKTTELILNIM